MAAKPLKRLHPDDLSGAILIRSHSLIETEAIDRTSGPQATTPYGMVQEAYLDGKWAFARKRSKLAVRSLQQALTLYPGHLPARELLVEIFSKEGKTGEPFLAARHIATYWLPGRRREPSGLGLAALWKGSAFPMRRSCATKELSTRRICARI